MTKKPVLIIILLLCTSSLSEALSPSKDQSTILTAYRTNNYVFLDGYPGETDWQHANELIIKVQDGSIGTVEVSLKALYDSEYLYILASWPDPTESISIDMWVFDGENWTSSGNEDRITFFWNIDDSIAGFNIAGCAMLCHGDRMHTNAPGERGDLWYWKAARTNPLGYADDQWIDNTLIAGYDHEAKEAALRRDSTESLLEGLSSGYMRNINERGDAPRYYKPQIDDENIFIFWEDVKKGRVLEVAGRTFRKGYTVPGYILRRPTGSQGDIDAKGTWRNGRWTVEFRRKLQTGNPDDVQFDVSKTYRFGVAVMDNTSGFEAYGIGHSFDLGARTLEFGGLTRESITHLTLIKDYLTISRAHLVKGNLGLAYSSLDDALILYNKISEEVSTADPALYIETKRQFTKVKRSLSSEKIFNLQGYIDLAILTLQGKRVPAEPSWDVKLLVFWGRIQVYTLIFIAVLALFPIIKAIQVGKKPTFRRLSIFLFIVIVPLIFEGIGRIGVLLENPVLEGFSFLTNEYATLLWAWLMLMGLFIARSGFGEVEESIHSLEYYSKQLEEDIKQRERLERRLRKSEEKYRGLFEHSLDGVADLSPEGNFITSNEAAAGMLGYSKEELKGLTLMDVAVNPEEGRVVVAQLREKGYLKDYVLNLKDKRGNTVIISISGRRIQDESGKHVRSEVIFRDITERVKSEEEKLALEQQLAQTERLASVGKLAAGVAHEINNPLTNIMLASEKLSKMGLVKEVQESVNVIMRNVDAAARIARNLLAFSRRTTPVLRETDIMEILDSTLELLHSRMKNIKIILDLDKIPKIKVDPTQLQQVFTNILINAIQSMPDGGELRITGKTKGDYLELSFEDTGKGIPREHLNKIFDPFYTTKEIGSGTGLGLSICYGIVKAHNGNIWVESRLNEGTKVTISLPLSINKVKKERRQKKGK
jgi:PAS domain S-box-containing protein